MLVTKRTGECWRKRCKRKPQQQQYHTTCIEKTRGGAVQRIEGHVACIGKELSGSRKGGELETIAGKEVEKSDYTVRKYPTHRDSNVVDLLRFAVEKKCLRRDARFPSNAS
jgi:hypothetical protein